MESRDWTADDDALLMKMRAQNIPYKEIASVMGRSIDALDSRRRILSLGHSKARELMVRKNLARQINRKVGVFRNYPSDPSFVPDHVLTDRAARQSAPATPNVIVLGDPPVGFSALDRKLAEVRA